MGFIKTFFKKKEDPETKINIENVGALNWDCESEYWVGSYNSVNISVAYDGLAKPKQDLSDFVTNTLSESGFPDKIMLKIKQLAKSKYSVEKHKEIESLEPKDIVFQSPTFILIQFFGSNDNEPFWFSEIHGKDIYVGFDT